MNITEQLLRERHKCLLKLPPDRRDYIIREALLRDYANGDCYLFTNRVGKTFYKYV